MTAPSLLDELEEEITPSLADMLAVVDEARMHMAGRLNSNGCREITDRRLSELRENIADMAKRLEAAERDSKRYRWLRDRASKDDWDKMAFGCVTDYQLDAYIDAATQEGAG